MPLLIQAVLLLLKHKNVALNSNLNSPAVNVQWFLTVNYASVDIICTPYFGQAFCPFALLFQKPFFLDTVHAF